MNDIPDFHERRKIRQDRLKEEAELEKVRKRIERGDGGHNKKVESERKRRVAAARSRERHRGEAREARNARMNEYWQEHKDELNPERRERYARDPVYREEARERMRKNYARNKKLIKARQCLAYWKRQVAELTGEWDDL